MRSPSGLFIKVTHAQAQRRPSCRCLLPLALAGCGEPADHDDPRIRPPLVRVATVERAEAGSRAFTGVVVARTQSDLGFRVAGKVLERRVETGQSVKRGQLLLRLGSG